MESKENFCGSCVIVPLAFAGSGLTLYGSSESTKGEHKKYKKILLVSGIVTLLLIGLFMLTSSNKCNSSTVCKLK